MKIFDKNKLKRLMIIVALSIVLFIIACIIKPRIQEHQILKAIQSQMKGEDNQLYYLAYSYQSDKKYTKSKKIYQKLIDLYPDSEFASQAMCELARITEQTSNSNEEIIEAYYKLINTYPDNVSSTFGLSRLIVFEKKKGKQSSTIYTEIIHKHPDSRMAITALDRLIQEKTTEDKSEILKLCQKLINSYPDKEIGMASLKGIMGILDENKEYDNLRLLCETTLIQHWDKRIGLSALEKLISFYSRHQRDDLVIALCSQQVRDHPESELAKKAQKVLADTYYKTGKYVEAITLYSDFIEKHPEESKASIADKIAISSYRLHGEDKMAKQYEEMISRFQGDTTRATVEMSPIMEALADNFYKTKQYIKAIIFYKKATYASKKRPAKLNPNKEDELIFENDPKYSKEDLAAKARYWKAYLYYSRKEYNEAVPIYQEFLAKYPNAIEAANIHYDLSRYYLGGDEIGKAHEHLKLATSLCPRSPQIAKLKRKINSIYDKDRKLSKEIERQLKIAQADNISDEDASVAWYRAGQLWVKKGEYEKAISAFQKTANTYPNTKNAPKALYNIAMIYGNHLKNKEKMNQSIGQLMSKYPNHELSFKILSINK